MLKFLKNSYEFIKQYPAILYSIALVVFLPLVLFWSTFSTIQSFESRLDLNIRMQTGLIQDALALAVARDFPNAEAMQMTIDNFAKENPGKIENIRIIVKEGKEYKIVAAQKHEDVRKTVDVSASLVGDSLINDSWAIGDSTATYAMVDNSKRWKFFKPIVNNDTQQTYVLLAADIPLNEIDRLIAGTVWQAYAVLAVVILLVLFLIFQHTRLFSFVFLSKKLQEIDKMKDGFIRMATHELQSPVTNIRGYIEALQEEMAVTATDKEKKYLEIISMCAKNLGDLIFDILEVSHLQQGRMDFAPQKIDASQTVKEIFETVKRKAETKGLAISLEGAEAPHFVNVNAVRFKQIVTNLIENSIKYTPAGSVKISVNAETAKKRLVITVQDTGFGISAEAQKHLFEQFYRVKTPENAGIPGTGLGLWISRQMAQKMGGDILIESIERMGSRFFVIFPLAGN